MASPTIILIAHNIRSIHNIGSLARTADAFGVSIIYATGYTPYLTTTKDERPPHVIKRFIKEVHKTALGAEEHVQIEHAETLEVLIKNLKKEGFTVLALEQARNSIPLDAYKPGLKTALMIGPEVTGLSQQELSMADYILEIPMLGKKESLNVSVAGAIAMYELNRKQLY